ncbi:MAG: RluA family pseudouridine synthase [Firmicutes bacterium]|nr:RluA family pseudouridine synthase [Bacillota bacterium]
MINVIYEDNHLLVVEKPVNIIVQEDDTKDKDLLTILKEYLKVKYNKPGNVFLGLVHRLDRPVGGIMVFAKTSKAASRLSDQVRNNKFEKTYHAVICGKVKTEDTLQDKLLKDITKNITRVDKRGKDSSLSYKLIGYKDGMSLVKIELHTGRSHQIRVQFSSRNLPLWGDQKYNKKSIAGEQIALFASSLSFFHPVTYKKLTFSLELPTTYPWNIF